VKVLFTHAVVLAILTLCAGCRSVSVDPLAISDAQTAVRVKTALVNDPELGLRTIEVTVARGVVALSGGVQTQAEMDRAVAIARAVPGVADVRANLRIGQTVAPVADGPSPQASRLPEVGSPELQDNPNLLAVGASVAWSSPRSGALKSRVSVGPLFKLGSGRGFGWAVGFDWFKAEVQSGAGRPAGLTRVQVKPVMVGASYTVGSDRTSLSGSLVGGYAWNSLTVTDLGTATGLPVEVDNSFVWRPALSFWHDLSRRTALNLSVGHVVTRLRLTVLEDGRLEKRPVKGDTTIVHAGIAYRLF
jgi:hypothetical protein